VRNIFVKHLTKYIAQKARNLSRNNPLQKLFSALSNLSETLDVMA
jgi:hypothetical protein